MVCIAAFIILCLISVVVAFLSIFKRDIGAKWWKVFKKAWHCVFKKVRLQKCDTNFKDDVKNTILKKVIIKHPKWVKPLSVIIEILAVVIVAITVWSIVVAIKSLLALWVFGTCNVSQPASCALGAEICSIDADEPHGVVEKTGRWFEEWGEIFSAIPDRLHSWDASEYGVGVFGGDVNAASVSSEEGRQSGRRALDIVDPGCSVCMQSYKNQLDSGFMGSHNVIVMPYTIKLPDGTTKFQNSELATRYLISLALYGATHDDLPYYKKMVDKIFTEFNAEGINYQSYIQSLDADKAEELFKEFLAEFGMEKEDIAVVAETAHAIVVDNYLTEIAEMVENTVHAKGIPTLIYGNRKHNGLFKK